MRKPDVAASQQALAVRGPGLAQARERGAAGTWAPVVVGGIAVVANQSQVEAGSSVVHAGEGGSAGQSAQVPGLHKALAERAPSADKLRLLIAERRVSYGMLARVWGVDKKRAYVLVTRESGPGAERLAMLPAWMRRGLEAA